MANVVVSLPDDLLRAIDVEASRRGTTRSGNLRQLAGGTIRRRSLDRAARMASLDDLDRPRSGHGFDVAELVKQCRRTR